MLSRINIVKETHMALLERHGLLPKWNAFESNYLGGGHE